MPVLPNVPLNKDELHARLHRHHGFLHDYFGGENLEAVVGSVIEFIGCTLGDFPEAARMYYWARCMECLLLMPQQWAVNQVKASNEDSQDESLMVESAIRLHS